MSLYTIKKLQLFSVLKVYAILIGIIVVLGFIGILIYGMTFLRGFYAPFQIKFFLSTMAFALIFYSIAVLALTLFTSWIYNLIAKYAGGIVVELESND